MHLESSILIIHIHTYSSQCTKDYVQIYYGNDLTSSNIARFSGSYEGRICDDRGYNLFYTIFDTTITVVIHTDSSGSRNRGVNVTFTARGMHIYAGMLAIFEM